MPDSVKRLLEIYEDVVELSLVLEVFRKEDSHVEDLLSNTSAFLEAGLYFGDDVLGLGSQSVQDDPTIALLE